MPDFAADPQSSWAQASYSELKEWVGVDIAEGVQEENGVKYEFQMWVRNSM